MVAVRVVGAAGRAAAGYLCLQALPTPPMIQNDWLSVSLPGGLGTRVLGGCAEQWRKAERPWAVVL